MIGISEISRRLAARAEDVCHRLLPGGKRAGHVWEVGNVNGSPGKSCKINLTGEHAGKWCDFAGDCDRGDLIDLWQAVKGCDRFAALREAKSFLGIADALEAPQKLYAKPPDKATVKAIADQGAVMQYLTGERKLEAKTINRFRIHGDAERQCIVYPSYSPQGDLVNRCYIGLHRDAEGKKSVWQDKDCAPCLWGWQGLLDEAIYKRTLLICEGQIDAMTWTQWGIPALSIPNGGGQTWIAYEWERLEAFDTIFLSFDMDGKSDENLRGVAARLGLGRCRVVKLPYKDANDALKKGMTAEQAQFCVVSAEWINYEGLSDVTEFRQEVLDEFFPPPDRKPGFSASIFRRGEDGVFFRPGEITVWTGVASHGKSTLLGFLMCLAIIAGENVMVASMEMPSRKVIHRMVQSALGESRPNKEHIEDIIENLRGKLCLAKELGYIKKEKLMEMMAYAFSRFGAQHFLVDSLMRVEGLEEDYPAQGDFLNGLAKFVKERGTHVHLVCHPRKMNEENNPGKMDVKGSSLIINNCDNIMSVRRNLEKLAIMKERDITPDEDKNMPDTFVTCEKQRETGWEGRFELRFCPRTYRFTKFTR